MPVLRRRMLAVALSGVMLVGVGACSDDDDDDTTETDTTEETDPTTETSAP